MWCSFCCGVQMSPLYLPVQTHSAIYGVGSKLEKVKVGMENPYDYTVNSRNEKVPMVCSENLYVCPKCGIVRMKIPERILEDKELYGMTTKQRKQYRERKMKERRECDV